eukprot:g7555.t1
MTSLYLFTLNDFTGQGNVNVRSSSSGSEGTLASSFSVASIIIPPLRPSIASSIPRSGRTIICSDTSLSTTCLYKRAVVKRTRTVDFHVSAAFEFGQLFHLALLRWRLGYRCLLRPFLLVDVRRLTRRDLIS